MNVASQVEKVVRKANGMLAFIGRGIEYKSCHLMLQLYRTLVRLHLEYCVQFWSPYYRKDVESLERVQRRFTRMLPGMGGLGYEERLKKLGLFSLERRRLRGDMIEVYKIMKGMDRVNSERLLPRLDTNTRGHHLRVRGERYNLEVRRRFFTQRVVGVWNALPSRVVEAGMLDSFKMQLDRHMSETRMEGYGRGH